MSVGHSIYLTGALSHTATLAVTWWSCVGVSGRNRVVVCHGEVAWVRLPVPCSGYVMLWACVAVWQVCAILTVIIQDPQSCHGCGQNLCHPSAGAVTMAVQRVAWCSCVCVVWCVVYGCVLWSVPTTCFSGFHPKYFQLTIVC